MALTAITSYTWWSHQGRQREWLPNGMLGLLLHIITSTALHYKPEGSSFHSRRRRRVHSLSTGSCWPSILTVIVKRSFNHLYQMLSGLRTNSSTPAGRVKTKSSWLQPWNCLPGNSQHCNCSSPSWFQPCPVDADVSLSLDGCKAGLIFWTAEDFCLACSSGLAGLVGTSASSGNS